jgi:ATP-dependent Clp protease protease subunit
MSNSQFRAKGKTGEIWLYDAVGSGGFFSDGITARQFERELTALGKVDTINLRINSPGGDVFDGVAIFNQLQRHPARIVVDVDGIAASIASIIAMAGDSINIAGNAMMMIHNPQGMAFGDQREMQRVAALLDTIAGTMADTYVARTGAKRADILGWMDDETWLTSEQAVAYGFADGVTAPQHVSACFDLLAHFRNTPRNLRAAAQASDAAQAATDVARIRIAQAADRLRARTAA